VTMSPPAPPLPPTPASAAAVDLYWLPLGAGGHSVRLNGLVFEAIAARLQHRTRCDLYHSALEVRVAADRYVIEMAPVWNDRVPARGVVAEGPVGSGRLGRLRLFRYEIRRWRGGRIPDIAEAVDSPQRLTEDPALARRLLELVPSVPTPVWGRDELRAGDMWNSNSVVAWLIVRAGIDARPAHVPAGGRAPGWDAGSAVARRAGGSAASAAGPPVAAADRRRAPRGRGETPRARPARPVTPTGRAPAARRLR
jgi:hypothetical protein